MVFPQQSPGPWKIYYGLSLYLLSRPAGPEKTYFCCQLFWHAHQFEKVLLRERERIKALFYKHVSRAGQGSPIPEESVGRSSVGCWKEAGWGGGSAAVPQGWKATLSWWLLLLQLSPPTCPGSQICYGLDCNSLSPAGNAEQGTQSRGRRARLSYRQVWEGLRRSLESGPSGEGCQPWRGPSDPLSVGSEALDALGECTSLSAVSHDFPEGPSCSLSPD